MMEYDNNMIMFIKTATLKPGSQINCFLEVRDSISQRIKKLKIIYVADDVPKTTPRIIFDKEILN